MTALQVQLAEKCRKMPKEQMREILDFAEFLLSKSSTARRTRRGPVNRSLRAFVGGVRHGALARDIDDDLYDRGDG